MKEIGRNWDEKKKWKEKIWKNVYKKEWKLKEERMKNKN